MLGDAAEWDVDKRLGVAKEVTKQIAFSSFNSVKSCFCFCFFFRGG